MINYRVENLEELLKKLKKEGVEIVGGDADFQLREIRLDHGSRGQ